MKGIKADAELTAGEHASNKAALVRVLERLFDGLERKGTDADTMATLHRIVLDSAEINRLAEEFAGNRADELVTRAEIAAADLVATPNARLVLNAALAMPPDTYSPETMRELYLTAVRQHEEGQDHTTKPNMRRRHTIRRIAVAWHECVGKKPTASFDSRDGCDRPTPFGRFAQAVLALAGVDVSLREIRSALHKNDQKRRRNLVDKSP